MLFVLLLLRLFGAVVVWLTAGVVLVILSLLLLVGWFSLILLFGHLFRTGPVLWLDTARFFGRFLVRLEIVLVVVLLLTVVRSSV